MDIAEVVNWFNINPETQEALTKIAIKLGIFLGLIIFSIIFF